MRAAEISGAHLAPLREGAMGDGSAGLLGAYGGKSVPTAIEIIEASVLMPSLGGSAAISLRQTSEFRSAEINWGFSWLADQGGPLSIGGPKGPGASNVASLDLGIGGELRPAHMSRSMPKRALSRPPPMLSSTRSRLLPSTA